MAYNSKGDFPTLKAVYNEVAAGGLRGVDAFCRLLEIQSQMRFTHNLDPARDASYSHLGTTQEKFRTLLSSQYFLAARQMCEGATDEHFLTAGRSILEALSDLHLVPVYMAMGKEAIGNKEPLTEEDWRTIGFSQDRYKSLVRQRLTDESKRVWSFAKERQGHYAAFVDLIHVTGMYLRQAGFDPAKDDVYQALGTTKVDFDDLLEKRRAMEQTRSLPHDLVVPARL